MHNIITGVHNKTDSNTIIETEIENGQTDVTHKIDGNTETENKGEIYDTPETDKQQMTKDDNISIELEDHDDHHITIYDLNIIEQMNTAQMNTDPKTGDDKSDNERRTVALHGYNLRLHQTCTNSKYALLQDGQQSTEAMMAKPHMHIMMMQMTIKQGIKAWSDAMLKELNQLHETKALLPLMKRGHVTRTEKKAFRYSMFLKEKTRRCD